MPRRRRPVRRRPTPPLPSLAAWMASRARNALRRPIFIGTVSIVIFAAALIAIVVVPQQARRAASALRPTASSRPDTEPTVLALRLAQRQVASADSAVVAARTQIGHMISAAAAAAAADTTAGGALSLDAQSRRDSLAANAALLTRLLARAENAPLLASYRALAEAPPMQADVRVKQLLDSLVEIERERDSYNAVGGVDPVFVALTARANELGHSIEVLADARRAATQRAIDSLAPPPPAVAAITTAPLPDTIARLKAADTARTVAAGVAARLAQERAELRALDARE